MTFEDDLKRLAPFIGQEKAVRLWRVSQQEGADGRRDLEAAIQLQLEKQIGATPLSPDQGLSLPMATDADGEYRLGNVATGKRVLYPFGLREDEFIQHMAIFGRSGAGKTNTIAILIRELVKHGKPFMIFDWKRNYRDLLAGPEPVPLEVYTVGQSVRPLHFNPLIPPPSTNLTVWLKKLIEIISTAFYLGEGVMFLLQEALDHVYRKFGCYDAQTVTRFPTMKDVLDHLQTMPVKGRKAMWMDSTLRAAQSLCFGQISDVINVSRNDSILDLLSQNACLELNSLANNEKTFFIETLMVWVHHFRMQEPDRETFKHCFIVEEAHNILKASAKETVVDLLLREIRELGEAIVLVDQHPSQISVPAMGNTYCTIALNMKHSKDIHALQEMMQVPRDQQDLFGLLPMGRALVKLQSRYLYPFQIHIPKVDIRKGSVTDADLRQIYPPEGDTTSSLPESDSIPTDADSKAIPPVRKEAETRPNTGLSAIEERLLLDIRDHPLDGVVKRYNRIGVSRRRGNHAKESLIAKGVIEPVDVPTGTGKVVLLDFTSAMEAAMRRNNVWDRNPREGGIIHTFWVSELSKAFSSEGWRVKREKPLGSGEAVDLDGVKNGTRVAIEVETGARGLANIQRLVQHGYDWILTFGVNDGTLEKTKRDLVGSNVNANNILFAKPADYRTKIAFLSRKAKRRNSGEERKPYKD